MEKTKVGKKHSKKESTTVKARVYPSDKLCSYIEEHPQTLLKEIAAHFGGSVSGVNDALAWAQIT